MACPRAERSYPAIKVNSHREDTRKKKKDKQETKVIGGPEEPGMVEGRRY
jgi:hypothetical protein